MKIKEILHKETRIYKILPLWARITLDHIHELQEKVEMLMAEYEKTKAKVSSNEAYVKKPKYHVPWGDFNTYSAAAKGHDSKQYPEPRMLKWTDIRKRIKSDLDSYSEYYLNI